MNKSENESSAGIEILRNFNILNDVLHFKNAVSLIVAKYEKIRKYSYKKYLIAIFLGFVSVNCFSEIPDNNSSSLRNSLKPACLQYCDTIKIIAFVSVDSSGTNVASRKDVWLAEMKKILKDNKKDAEIDVGFLPQEKSVNYFQALSTMINIDLYFHEDDCNKDALKIDVKVVAPNRFYANQFTCPKRDNFSCVDARLKEVSTDVVGKYLFEPAVGNIKILNRK